MPPSHHTRHYVVSYLSRAAYLLGESKFSEILQSSKKNTTELDAASDPIAREIAEKNNQRLLSPELSREDVLAMKPEYESFEIHAFITGWRAAWEKHFMHLTPTTNTPLRVALPTQRLSPLHKTQLDHHSIQKFKENHKFNNARLACKILGKEAFLNDLTVRNIYALSTYVPPLNLQDEESILSPVDSPNKAPDNIRDLILYVDYFTKIISSPTPPEMITNIYLKGKSRGQAECILGFYEGWHTEFQEKKQIPLIPPATIADSAQPIEEPAPPFSPSQFLEGDGADIPVPESSTQRPSYLFYTTGPSDPILPPSLQALSDDRQIPEDPVELWLDDMKEPPSFSVQGSPSSTLEEYFIIPNQNTERHSKDNTSTRNIIQFSASESIDADLDDVAFNIEQTP